MKVIMFLALLCIIGIVTYIVKLPDYLFVKWIWLLQGLASASFAVFFAWQINMYREKANINIDIDNSGCFYFPWDESDKYRAGNRLVMWVRISNLSSLANSIIEISLELPGSDRLYSYTHVKPLEEYIFSVENDSAKLPIGKHLVKAITVLEPFRGVDGFIFFPSYPSQNKALKGRLVIKTTRGTFKQETPIINRYSPEKAIAEI